MEVKINGYKFPEKEIANATRAELAIELGLPRKLGDVTIYWQNYQEASLNKPSFFYMVGDKSMVKALGKPSTFTVIFPSIDNSFISQFGEPISAYSLRNLTNNITQPVVRVSSGKGKEPEEYDLTESQINLKYLLGLSENLRVIKWYDQAGTDQSLITEPFIAPYLLKDGKMFFENLKPAIHFDNGNQLQLLTFLKPEKDNIRIYNVSSYAEVQKESLEGNSLLYNVNRRNDPVITWLPKDMLQMPFVEGPIVQNGGKGVSGEKGKFGPFLSPLKNLNLYQIQNSLRAPINFGFGNAVDMNMCEFILYPDENINITNVTENILNFYKIE